jgi:hypothetical protein
MISFSEYMKLRNGQVDENWKDNAMLAAGLTAGVVDG